MIPYDYDNSRGEGVLRGWAADKRESRAIRNHVWLAVRYSRQEGLNSFYFPVDESEKKPGIFYAKIRSSRQLRPRICLGPERPNDEITYLFRAIEDNYKISPRDATEKAFYRSQVVEEKPVEMRVRLTPQRTFTL